MPHYRSPSVVFTDLDATLLDHYDYDWRPAAAALDALAARGVPVCFVTSKTAAEVAVLRHEIGNVHPFAVENGGAVAVPRGYFDGARCDPDTPVDITDLGTPRAALCALAAVLRDAHDYRFTGFADMTAAQVAEATGLAIDDARRAMQRHASEPLLWQDSDAALAAFTAAVEAAGYVCRVGGRFVHVLGPVHKGRALQWLRERYAAAGGAIRAIALGDSGNDADMLAAADIGYWVAKPDGRYQQAAAGAIRHAPGRGPHGWAAAIDALIERGELSPAVD